MSASEGFLIERIQIGNSLEVRAIDPADGLEVSFIAPVNTPDAEIRLLSQRKLEFVRARHARAEAARASDASKDNKKRPLRNGRNGRGIIV